MSVNTNANAGGADPSASPPTTSAARDAAAAEPQPKEAEMDILRILLAVLLPPLGVFLQVGIGLHFWLNILLTLLGYVPGIIHAVWVILTKQ
jgi:uncharacterized membrane protein YqaE (UPF0057 family)